ncbi:MAG: hypothetical protein R3D55_15995 [Chloroflexota bacterium]
MKRKKVWKAPLIFVIVWFLLASIALGYWPLIRDQEEIATITHDLYGFSIDYPTKWKIRLYDEDGYRGFDDLKVRIYENNLSQFGISILQTTASEVVLQDVYSWRMQTIGQPNQEDFKYNEISLTEDNLNGHPILRHIYTVNNTKFEEVYFVRAHDMLSIRLHAPIGEFDNYLEEFEAIVASFQPLE